jgi:putative ABC transport system ATP-binding protein
MSTLPRVQIQELSHSFGTPDRAERVLRGINLAVAPGQMVILTGPSGCGKTTLLTLIGAVRSVQEGSVRVLGVELKGLNKKTRVAVRRDIGFIFQAHNLLDALSAAENIGLGLALHRHTAVSLQRHTTELLGVLPQVGDGPPPDSPPRSLAAALVSGLLAHLKLSGRATHKPQALSGGEKQRVAIARALVNRPRLILTDEPTAALDRSSCTLVVDLLRRMARGGSTVLIVTHDDRVMSQADRIVTMADGEIVSDEQVDETVRTCLCLRKAPLLSGLTPAQLVELADRAKIERHAAGSVLVRPGEVGKAVYVIRKGSVEVISGPGESPRVETLREGACFGARALAAREGSSATVRAAEEVELYTLGEAEFLAALAASEPMREELIKVFAQRHRHP